MAYRRGRRFGFKKGVSTKMIVRLLLMTIISLYVGGQVLDNFGTAMEDTCSPFYTGFSLIGWTVNSDNCIPTSGATSGGVLTVIGIVALAYVVTKVVYIKF